MNITGAIFDLDGTLLDSMPYWKNSGEIYLSKLGISTKEDLNSLFSTMTLQESSCYLKKRFNLSLSESEILNIIINTIEEFYEHVIPLKEGIVEFLLLLNKVNIPCVVATAADKVCALKSLNRLNITSFFDDVITDEALLRCLSALNLGKQYVALTEKACKNITVLKECPIYNLELALLQEKAKVRRLEGNALVKEIEKEYRRVGKYFDEILRGE